MVERYRMLVEDSDTEITRDPNGGWVRHNDYARLERENAELRKRHEADQRVESALERDLMDARAQRMEAETRAEDLSRQLAEARAELARVRNAWEVLDRAISSAIKENDQPHRVFRDGRVIMEGEAAELYHSHLMLLRRMGRAALSGSGDGGWRPMDSAPKDGTNILYRNKFRDIGFCHWDEGYNEDDVPAWWDNERDDEVCPVVWLPADTLPAFPAAPAPAGGAE